MSQLDALISQLDPDRHYGDRSYDDVVDGVRNGTLTIAPGAPVPILRDAATGRNIKGTGSSGIAMVQPTELAEIKAQRATAEGRGWFDSRIMGDYEPLPGPQSDRDKIYDRAMTVIQDGSRGHERLIEFFLTQHIGKPRETQTSTGRQMVEAIMEQLGEGQMARVRVAELGG